MQKFINLNKPLTADKITFTDDTEISKTNFYIIDKFIITSPCHQEEETSFTWYNTNFIKSIENVRTMEE